IVKLGVRVNPLTVDEMTNFDRGKSITTNADRTLKRSARRNLQRYKLRRENLIEVLKQNNLISDSTPLCECGNKTTFETYYLRAKAAKEEITLEELARVLLMINKKRGYKSSRKAKSGDEGTIIDGMSIAKQMYEEDITPGEYVLRLLEQGKNYVPDFYKSDLQDEMNQIWEYQKTNHPDILTEEFKSQIAGKGKQNTAKIFMGKYGIYTADNKGKDKKLQAYKWRVAALNSEITKEELAYVISDLNGLINNSSGYLGAISDRSKKLYFNKQTIGEYLISKMKENPHYSTRNVVFYRQDYLDEFEIIWEVQAKFHPELTPELKKELRDVVIFYQRALKSQKGLVSVCELENKEIEVYVDGKTKKKRIGYKVCPKSSPVFQNFKIWQILNNIQLKGSESRFLYEEEKELLFKELSYKDKLSDSEALKLLFTNTKGLSLNYKSIEGNRTQSSLFKAYEQIIAISGHGEYEFEKMGSDKVVSLVHEIFESLGYSTGILYYNPSLPGKAIEQQSMYQLWHLLYSYEGDKSCTGIESLVEILSSRYGFDKEYAKIIANVSFQQDYGSLSAKAIKNIMPHLMAGNEYSEACVLAGYNHSKASLTKEE
ncbi:MAG: type II CRISPR RNA-guided endonuclease Cas9, partial [Bacteroidales bacterium]|nr:type II CRISPR RNA-guided endonuclease Cas9 [Bacteroidales bacterium]